MYHTTKEEKEEEEEGNERKNVACYVCVCVYVGRSGRESSKWCECVSFNSPPPPRAFRVCLCVFVQVARITH